MADRKEQSSDRTPHENIRCKDCAYNKRDYSSLSCEKFTSKPHLIYSEGKRCPYYKRRESKVNNLLLKIIPFVAGIAVFLLISFIQMKLENKSNGIIGGLAWGILAGFNVKSIISSIAPGRPVFEWSGAVIACILTATPSILEMQNISIAIAVVSALVLLLLPLISTFVAKIGICSRDRYDVSLEAVGVAEDAVTSGTEQGLSDESGDGQSERNEKHNSSDIAASSGYEGEEKDGMFHGFGVYCYPSGNKYKGEWRFGERHGKGTVFYVNGDRYEGEWSRDKKNGNGTYYFENGDIYDGEWVDGDKHGKGAYHYANGDRYEGEWAHSNKHGKGVIYYAKGAKYEGEWAYDKLHGKGLWYMPGVGTEEYVFNNGNLVNKQINYGVSKDKYVFISYSTKNQEAADSVRRILIDDNVNTWMAPHNIPAGSKYAHVINDAIENCSCVLLLLSEYSQSSEWVEKEVERAVSNKKTIVALHIDESQLNSGFRFYLGNEQIVPVNSIDKNDSNIQKAIKAVKTFLT